MVTSILGRDSRGESATKESGLSIGTEAQQERCGLDGAKRGGQIKNASAKALGTIKHLVDQGCSDALRGAANERPQELHAVGVDQLQATLSTRVHDYGGRGGRVNPHRPFLRGVEGNTRISLSRDGDIRVVSSQGTEGITKDVKIINDGCGHDWSSIGGKPVQGLHREGEQEGTKHTTLPDALSRDNAGEGPIRQAKQ